MGVLGSGGPYPCLSREKRNEDKDTLILREETSGDSDSWSREEGSGAGALEFLEKRAGGLNS